jgi:steroid delta-isomerase-like uncharacterized protein
MASTSEIAKRYFAAIDAHDLDAAVALWEPGAVDRFVGDVEVTAPDGVKTYFSDVFAAFPDFSISVLDVTTARNRTAVRWKAHGTFAGPGQFRGFAPNGATVAIEGCDVLTIDDDLIRHNDAYLDGSDLARQLGFLPPAGSKAEARLAKLANVRTKLRSMIHGIAFERVADGVSVIRGGFPLKTMNVYFIEDGDGVTMFDAGISDMTDAVRIAGVRAGGIKRIVLGHADADHRGAAPGIKVPTYCHEQERAAAESDEPTRPYWDFKKLPPQGRAFFSRAIPAWDGGAVTIADTVKEGDEIAGFKVIELPGHAPGLIGLFREADRLALVSDCFYTIDPLTGRKGPARIPHPAFDDDVEQVRASIRKLAALNPSAAWPGHANPVQGDVAQELERAAAAAL